MPFTNENEGCRAQRGVGVRNHCRKLFREAERNVVFPHRRHSVLVLACMVIICTLNMRNIKKLKLCTQFFHNCQFIWSFPHSTFHRRRASLFIFIRDMWICPSAQKSASYQIKHANFFGGCQLMSIFSLILHIIMLHVCAAAAAATNDDKNANILTFRFWCIANMLLFWMRWNFQCKK